MVNCAKLKISLKQIDISNDLSASQHVQRLVTSSAQAMYALRVLRTRGLGDAALQHVSRATVVARLTYAASAWRGLTRASDRQRINSVIDRARRHGYCSADLSSFDELCDCRRRTVIQNCLFS